MNSAGVDRVVARSVSIQVDFIVPGIGLLAIGDQLPAGGATIRVDWTFPPSRG